MNFLLVNGSPNSNGLTKRALTEAEHSFKQHGHSSRFYELGKAPRPACLGCGKCRKDGNCIFGDLDTIAKLAHESDGIIFGTPTHYAGAGGGLVSLLSRLCFSKGYVLENKPVATVAAARRAGAIAAIREVNRFFSFTSSVLVGGIYPPHLYGGERDAEGLADARSVAENMIWIASCIKNAKANGILPFERINAVRTNI